MKWITHQSGGLLAALVMELPLAALAPVCFGAILPDMLDQSLAKMGATPKKRQQIFNRVHRGDSHWFGWWLLCLFATFYVPVQPLVRDVMAGIAIGSLTHVALDMLTPRGVPLLPFTRKNNVAIPLCSTGKASEYIFLFLLAAFGLAWLALFKYENLSGFLRLFNF